MNPNCEKTVENLFAGAIEIEGKTAQIYQRVSKMFTQVPGLIDFWQDLIRDEKQHGLMLGEVVKLLTAEQLHSPANEALWQDIEKTQLMLARSLVQPIETLDDAYELAHELEFSEINTVFKALAGDFICSDLRKKFVYAEIVAHQKKLTNFRQRFGDRAWRKEIRACVAAN